MFDLFPHLCRHLGLALLLAGVLLPHLQHLILVLVPDLLPLLLQNLNQSELSIAAN